MSNILKRPEKNRHKRLKTSSRTGRPNEYPKAPVRVPQTGKPDRQAIRILQSFSANASNPQVVPEGQTNTQKLPCECLKPTSRTGRPNEYPKAPVRVPRTDKSDRQAKRIPQSSSASASNRQVAPAGHTNTSKLQCECLKTPSRTDRPYEYLKAPVRVPQTGKSYRQAKRIPKSSGVSASNRQAVPAGPTNTQKLQAQMAQSLKSQRQAKNHFLATSMTAAMMRAMPRRSQAPKRRWKRKKEKMTDETGSMAPMILVSAGRM